MTARRIPRRQCAKCPWKVGANPRDIPNGYCATKHANLENTIAKDPVSSITSTLHIMACHEVHNLPCIGWLANQIGPGNNIGLRLAVTRGDFDANVETVGPQHEIFEDTLPDGVR